MFPAANRMQQSHHESVWRNTGAKFGTGCTDWGKQIECGVGGGFPDFLFQILGGDDPADGTPAVGPLGVLLITIALGGGGGYVLARRRRAAS